MRKLLSMTLLAVTMLSMLMVGAQAADYSFTTDGTPDYYSSTSYEEVYGSQYNYGGSNLIDYKWRPFNEFPPIDLVIKESQPNISRFKAVGVGEISGSAGAAAIAMAIGNAIGKPYMKYPATPVNVLQALKEG